MIEKTIVIGISGPSSSGKTTLARLLRTVFTPPTSHPDSTRDSDIDISPLIVHEDDFYKPDDQIPVITTSSGKPVQDWDTIDAIDVDPFVASLSHIRRSGSLPSNLRSKEDLNDATDSGVNDTIIKALQKRVAQRLQHELENRPNKPDSQHQQQDGGGYPQIVLSLAFVDGFLLYAPPQEPSHPLRRIHDQIDLPIFLPVTYPLLKERREGRTGYVTIGPAPTPVLKTDQDTAQTTGSSADENMGKHEQKQEETSNVIQEYDPPQTNFWTDPPGYVDDIVWPRYISNFSWLLLPKSIANKSMGTEELKNLVGDGSNIREDQGVCVAIRNGKASMPELLDWALELVLAKVDDVIRAAS